jgi:hypothetical protein
LSFRGRPLPENLIRISCKEESAPTVHTYYVADDEVEWNYTPPAILYANLPMMTMKKGERVRWYVVTLGEGLSLHTPHWHGNVVVQNGKRTDVIFIAPAQMETVDMVPDDPASGCSTTISTNTCKPA